MEIPDSSIGWGLSLLGVIVGWLVRLEARLNARPTREEQETAAAKVAHVMRIDFEDIKRMLEKQNESSLLHRQWVGDSLAEIRTKVAVLRDRAGDDPHDDIERWRRE
jgi:hypothetical protein